MAPGAEAEGGGKAERLDHLTGARCLASTWIVCGHFLPPLAPTALSPARYRADVAVCFFIVMSGFITHWVYGPRLLRSGGAGILRFYIRRILRVVVTTWVAMLWGLGVVIIQLRGGLPDLGHLVRCFSFVEPWTDPLTWCPNGQTWTVAALLPSWLLYPATCRALAALEACAGASGLCAAALCLWLLSVGPAVGQFWEQRGHISNEQGLWGYIWPPAQMPDFVLGAVAAALARRHAHAVPRPELEHAASGAPPVDGGGSDGEAWPEARRRARRRTCGLLADASVAVIAVMVFAMPAAAVPREDGEVFFNHGLSMLLATFLYFSSIEVGSGLVAKLMCHETLVACGEYSFEVYLFQYPLHEVFVAWGDVSGTFDMRNADHTHQTNSCGFMAFFFSLWLFAGVYAEFVESHLVSWLRALATASCCSGPEGLAAEAASRESVELRGGQPRQPSREGPYRRMPLDAPLDTG